MVTEEVEWVPQGPGLAGPTVDSDRTWAFKLSAPGNQWKVLSREMIWHFTKLAVAVRARERGEALGVGEAIKEAIAMAMQEMESSGPV